MVGFVLLIKGADFFVEGSSSVARALRIPSMIVGLTIVAMGTSLPELAVSVTASVAGNNALAVSNVIGSNLFNLMFVCGACALFAPLIVQKDTLKKEIPVSVLCAVLLFVLGISGMEIGRTDGVILLLLFIGFLVWMVRSALKAHAASAEAEDPSGEYKIYPAWKCALYIVGGAVAIKFGGDFVVDGASAIAVKAGLSQNLIGLTIVAMGTSLPECAVSVTASLTGNNSLAVSNVVGSNIFNGLVVVGVCAFLSAFKTNRDILKRDMPLNILVTFILCLMFLDGKLNRIEGGILFAGMILYITVMIYHAIKNKSENEPEKILSLPRSIIYMIAGLAAVIFGGDLVVDKACIIATNFGVSQNFIGLTIVAIGTSLPELVTSIVATKKGDSGLALGNAIGSNLFNILFILGFSAILSPLHVLNESIIDCGILLISSILLFIFAKTKQHMSKLEGIVCIGLYLAYMGYLLI